MDNDSQTTAKLKKPACSGSRCFTQIHFVLGCIPLCTVRTNDWISFKIKRKNIMNQGCAIEHLVIYSMNRLTH